MPQRSQASGQPAEWSVACGWADCQAVMDLFQSSPVRAVREAGKAVLLALPVGEEDGLDGGEQGAGPW
ncbi:hypothetical protein VR44_05915 [Streptomyces katrae]|uniref:Uncharacterized protein n=1 Tax=Streptomyces katrae TaxID=68223 RepID=A0A0F4JSJ0_9ACTN|nr:hypothetical protein VR44_05915 [Streptomyces katrae]